MVTTMCMDVNSVAIKAAAVWIDGNSDNKGHGTSNPQGASLFLENCIAPIELQARVPGYSQRPSVTKTRLWLQASDLTLKLYHSFSLFPKPPVFITRTGGFDILERLFFVYSGTSSDYQIPAAFIPVGFYSWMQETVKNASGFLVFHL